MGIVEIIIGIIKSRKYLTIAEKYRLENDIKFNNDVKSKLKEKEVGIEELTKEIQEIEKKLEKLEKMKEAIQEILIKENYLKKIIKELKNERRGL